MELFGAEHANVQPHAGAQANNAAYMAMLEPGDTIMGMALDHGGHLTHGMKLNVSGKLYEVVAYHVRREDYRCDMDEVERLADEHKPKVIVAGWSAYPRQLDFAAFREIADSVGAKLMVDMAHFAGPRRRRRAPEPGRARRRRHDDDPQDALRPAQRDDPLPRGARQGHRPLGLPRPAGRAADAHHRRQGRGAGDRRSPSRSARASARRSPTRKAFAEGLIAGGVDVLTGGTDVHLVLVDLTPTGLDGKTAEQRLEEVGITVNRNAIPFDERPPMNPSGLRIGTPALTTRGLGEDEMREIAAGDRGRALGPLRVRARRAARAHPGPDGALPALPAALRGRRSEPDAAELGVADRVPSQMRRGCGPAPWRRPAAL